MRQFFHTSQTTQEASSDQIELHSRCYEKKLTLRRDVTFRTKAFIKRTEEWNKLNVRCEKEASAD